MKWVARPLGEVDNVQWQSSSTEEGRSPTNIWGNNSFTDINSFADMNWSIRIDMYMQWNEDGLNKLAKNLFICGFNKSFSFNSITICKKVDLQNLILLLSSKLFLIVVCVILFPLIRLQEPVHYLLTNFHSSDVNRVLERHYACLQSNKTKLPILTW